MHNNMKHIKLFEQFINENTSGEDVWNHIVGITPEEDDIPWGFQDKIENKNFKATKIDLKKLLKSDPDFKEYYNSGEERYDQDEVDSFDVYNELVVVDGELLDGYSRASRLLRQVKRKQMHLLVNHLLQRKNQQELQIFISPMRLRPKVDLEIFQLKT